MPLIRLRGEPEKDGKMDEGQACKSAYFVAYLILSACGLFYDILSTAPI
jgi:hypothetical protein